MTESSAIQAKPHPGGTATFAGRTVSRIGFGAMQLDRLKDDRDSAIRVVRRAVELGVDHIDTAQFYGNGFVNGVIHDALQAGPRIQQPWSRTCRHSHPERGPG